jgi:putative spermidine/putrescine transport system ATP-binding protein/molybdate/tungstate transport system ATP-binding protein
MMLELAGLSHRYDTELAVDELSLCVDAGELVALLGPSGCGKTTVVQAIAGHLRPTTGRVLLRGEDVTDSPPEHRDVGVVFQQSTLFPHMTVRENIAYGLAPLAPDRPGDRVTESLDLVALAGQGAAYPAQLSGGQRRRAELARALAPRPELLLLDEPLSALDRALREQLREEIARIQRETGVTTLFVTHDQNDAMALADRLVVMNEGRVAGVGPPRRLYQSPPTPFVASFLGRSNTLSATVVGGEPPTIAVGDATVRLPESASFSERTTVTCHVRPGAVTLDPSDAGEDSLVLPGAVVRVSDVGHRYDVTVRSQTGETVLVEQSDEPPPAGESVTLGLPREGLTLFE